MKLDLVLRVLEEGLYLFTLGVVRVFGASTWNRGVLGGGHIDFSRIRTLSSKGWPFGSQLSSLLLYHYLLRFREQVCSR